MKGWTITFGTRSWTDDDAVTAHAVAVADLIGDSWDAVSPWSGPRALAAWVAVLSAGVTGDLEAAVVDVYRLPITALADCLAERSESEPPPDGSGSAVVPSGPVTPSGGVSFVDAA